MKRVKRLWPFVLAGLGVCLLLAVVVSPFASTAPDGLERVAHDQGFLAQSQGRPVWRGAPAADYALPGVRSGGLSTALAGLAGTMIVFGLALGLGRTLARRKRDEAGGSRRDATGSRRDSAAG